MTANRPNRKFTDDQLLKLIEDGITSNSEAAKILGVSRRAIYDRKLKLNIKDHHDPSLIPEGYKLRGHSGMYDADGNLKIQWVKTTVDHDQKETVVKILMDQLKKELKPLPASAYKFSSENVEETMTVYPLGDPHIGMFADETETGYSSWGLVEAQELYRTVFRDLVKRSPPSERAVIVNLGDFFHYDNMEGVTARSKNVLDRDGKYYKMVAVGIAIMRQMIADALEHHKYVEVINVVGNHDDCGALFLSAALAHMYENEPRIKIHQNPSAFNYIQYGKVLIGTHHGHGAKMQDLPQIMATDKPQGWGSSEHRYWLTGHIHHDSKKEYAGCTVESFRTLAPLDNYAANHGYRGGRAIQAIVYHKEAGEVGRQIIKIRENYKH
jgi:hypothetical protein